MNNFAFETNTATNFIDNAMKDFLRDKKLKLTTQQYNKLKKLLMVRLLEEEMSYSSAYNHLSEIVEYRKDYEINANSPDEAEEEMIRIIGAADTQEVEVTIETTRFKKRFIIVATLLTFLCIGLLSFQGILYLKNRAIEMTAIITSAEETELKALVEKVASLEKLRGNEITTAAIYNKIKKLDAVTAYGTATSYKKFNHAQHKASVKFLNNLIINLSKEINVQNP